MKVGQKIKVGEYEGTVTKVNRKSFRADFVFADGTGANYAFADRGGAFVTGVFYQAGLGLYVPGRYAAA